MTSCREIRSDDLYERRGIKKSVAIFGLSANPPTGDEGHAGIVKNLVDSGSFDEVWILPVYQHMFVAKKSLESFEHRLAMCQLCFAPTSSMRCKVKVLPLEMEAYEEAMSLQKIINDPTKTYRKEIVDEPIRLGTIDIIRFIKKKNNISRKATAAGIAGEPLTEGGENDIELDLHLVLGSDTFMDLMMGKWRDAESLVSEVILEVFQRLGGSKISDLLNGSSSSLKGKTTVHEHYVEGLGSVSRRKRLYRRLLLASASLAAVAGIALIRLRVKYR